MLPAKSYLPKWMSHLSVHKSCCQLTKFYRLCVEWRHRRAEAARLPNGLGRQHGQVAGPAEHQGRRHGECVSDSRRCCLRTMTNSSPASRLSRLDVAFYIRPITVWRGMDHPNPVPRGPLVWRCLLSLYQDLCVMSMTAMRFMVVLIYARWTRKPKTSKNGIGILGPNLIFVCGLVKFVPTLASLVCLNLLGFCKH